MGIFAYRLFGAMMLDASVYEGVEADRRAAGQAALAVLLSSLAAGIGSAGWHGPAFSTPLIVAAVALATWIAWAVLTYQVGARWLPEADTHATLGELIRTTGFAAAPGVLQVFGAFPGMRRIAFAVAWVWMFVAMVIAVKHALDYRSTWHTVVVCMVAASIPLALVVVLGLLWAPVVS